MAGEGGEGTGDQGEGPGGEGGGVETWTEGLGEEVRGWVESKGWQTADDAFASHRSLEQMQRVPRERLLEIPETADDATAWSGVYQRLGAPAEASGYEFPEVQVGEGQVDLRGKFREWAHKRHLTKDQASGLFEDFQAEMGGIEEAALEERNQQSELEMAALKKSWGQEYDANVLAGKRAARGLGLDEAQLGSLEDALGTREMLELMAKIGRGIGEYKLPDEETTLGQPFGLTPDAARVKIAELQADPEYQKAFRPDATPVMQEAAREKMQRLQKIAYPEGA